MNKIHYISPEKLTWEKLDEVIKGDYNLALSEESEKLIQKCRTYLDNKIETEDKPIYGINTGFGSLYNKSISTKDLTLLQENLVMSHACGMGDEVNKDIVKLMLFLKVHALSLGFSGVNVSTVRRLIDFYNNDIYPIVYQLGSLGASGDLAPLAHLSLPLIGKGEVYYKGEKRSAESVLKEFSWVPLKLQSKEGLALLNGTQFMSAHGVNIILNAFKLSKLADISGAISLEAYDGRIDLILGKWRLPIILDLCYKVVR